MNDLQSLVERLRPLVGLKGWDYCVLWKLRDDQSCFEWMGCCCGGAESNERGEEQLFPVSPIRPCRDMMFQHPRTKSCDFLSELPSSMSLDSGIYTQALISSQPKWINFSNISDLNISDETVRTRLLIPVGKRLVELFAAKHVHEDEHTVEFVMAQCNHPWDQEAMIDFPADQSLINNREIETTPINYDSKSNNTHFQNWLPPPTDNLNLAWDLSPTPNAFVPDGTSTLRNPLFLDGSTDSILSDKPPAAGIDHGFPDIVSLHQSLRNASPNLQHPSIANSSSVTKDVDHHDKESFKHEVGRGDSVSDCSDQVEDDDDHKPVGRSGRKHQSKNLMAERKRRKKLNDRLYALRALVPKITKMDRASILGDAIEFVKELQKQVKDLQDELEEETQPPAEVDDCSGGKQSGIINNNNSSSNNNNSGQSESSQQKVAKSVGDGDSPNGLRMEVTDHGTRCSSISKTADPIKANHDPADKTQQMEPQVEVNQVEGDGLYLKVFCEYRPGGFVRLMEAVNSMGLEVTNANVTTFRTLVLNVFKVQKRDNEAVQAHQVRDSLLEITRNPSGIFMWAECGGNMDDINNNNGESSTEHQQQQSQQHHHTRAHAHHHINLHHLQHFSHS